MPYGPGLAQGYVLGASAVKSSVHFLHTCSAQWMGFSSVILCVRKLEAERFSASPIAQGLLGRRMWQATGPRCECANSKRVRESATFHDAKAVA
jgi:hypothetical protein